MVETLKRRVSDGWNLSESMRDCGQFPPIVVALVEESGQLDRMMARAAVALDREFEVRMLRLLASLQPALAVLLGAVGGVLLLALYLPIFGLGRTLIR
jgi:type IV pilus assembly protein PilC